MANTKISALTALTNPTGSEEFVYAYNNANWKITLDTMKSFVGWAGITTLTADANIWELSEWIYVTTYELYYKTWENVSHVDSVDSSWKHMLFVVEESTWEKSFFVYNIWHSTIIDWRARAAFGYSVSSSIWDINYLWKYNWSLNHFGASVEAWATGAASPLSEDNITQLINNVMWTSTLTVSSQYPPYKWVPYTIIFNSIASGETYSVTTWTGVTNPYGITLPSSSTKKCVITLMPTSASTAIITGCTIEP